MANLIVQPAQDAAARSGMVILNKVSPDAGFREALGLEGFHKKSAPVAKDLRPDQNDLGDTGWDEFHRFPSSDYTVITFSPRTGL
jgi:hypothetical protein